MIRIGHASYFLFVFLLFSFGQKVYAKHIVGGEVYYDCLGYDTIGTQVFINYLITANMYRDAAGGGAQLDSEANFGLYKGNGSNWTFIQTYSPPVTGTALLPVNDDPCIETPNNLAVQKGTYEFYIKVPKVNQSYRLAYQRCCRNNSILNIVNPESTGAVFEVEITPEAQEICNDTPRFNEFPPILICANRPLVVDHSATDEEGHTLVYEFCAPGESGGTLGTPDNPGNASDCDGVQPSPVNCLPPYDDVIFKLPEFSFDKPMGSGTNLQINSQTGIITGNPTLLGQYVVGVCITEYKDGVLLSQVRRDFQFNVTSCEILVDAQLQNDAVIKEQEFLINSCGSKVVKIINESQDEKYIEGYLWTFDLGNGDIVTGNTRDIEVTFPDFGSYTGSLVVNPESNGCRDTAYVQIKVYPDVTADFEFSYDTCSAGPVKFTDKSESGAQVILGWNWNMNIQDTLLDQNPSYQFPSAGSKEITLIVTDINNCMDTITKNVDWYPSPNNVVIEPSNFIGCIPSSIFFNNLSFPVNSTYDILWTFGDGMQDTVVSPTHVYTETGVYTISLSLVSPLGCEASQTFHNLIQIEPSPEVDFTYSPSDNISNINNIVEFEEQCKDAVSWQYIINDTLASYFQPNVTHAFQDTGIHKIDLIAIHPSGCPDTITKYIDVVPIGNLFLPNAFSPNGDGENDNFVGKGDLFGIKDYRISIWNRWGEEVFNSVNPKESWNGRNKNTGSDAPTGVYVYQIHYVAARNEIVNKKGTVTLVR